MKKYELIAEKKQFTDNQGEVRDYISLTVKIQDKVFILRPLDKDRSFISYLISNELK